MKANILSLLKNGERYIYVYGDESIDALAAHLRSRAGNPELSLGWYDAAMLQQRIRKLHPSPSL